MSIATSRVQIRMDSNLKNTAENIMRKNGFNPSQLVNLIYFNIAKTKELPILIKKIPNQLTKETVENADKGIDLIECNDFEDCLSQLKL